MVSGGYFQNRRTKAAEQWAFHLQIANQTVYDQTIAIKQISSSCSVED
jgi:hypothetical protein